MPKKSISSLELAALTQELQRVVPAKISQIYQQDQELWFQLHILGLGKELLRIIMGKWVCLTAKKDAPLHPSSFCMQLRKYLDGAFVKEIRQHDSERIMILEVEGKEDYHLIIELFSKGNLILADKNWKIITALQQQTWKDRTIKPGEKYLFPPAAKNWKTMSEKELGDILQKSEKRNLVTSLATEIGLGGRYAEELCLRAAVNKDKIPTALEKGEVENLHNQLKELLKLVEHPHGCSYPDDITPFPLLGKKPLKITATYSGALDTLHPFQKTSPYQQKINSLLRTIADQEESILGLQEKIITNKEKGELMYQKYAPLQKLLEIVQEMKKSKNWQEMGKELAREKKIRKIDLKNKKIILDL